MYPGLSLLAEETGAILIAPNFRLGTLGFLALDPATNITGAARSLLPPRLCVDVVVASS